MGYHMDQQDAKFKILAKNIPNVVNNIRELNITTYSNGSLKYVINVNDQNEMDISKLMESWMWEIGMDSSGDIDDIRFLGEKLGEDSALFNAIAPFVKNGSYIEMRGEDASVWRWLFTNGTVKEITPHITWTS